MESSLHATGLAQLLDADPRPTFVVALPPPGGLSTRDITHKNAALFADQTLLSTILNTTHDASHARFWDWVSGLSTPPPSQILDRGLRDPADSLAYLGTSWLRSVLLQRWVVVTRHDMPHSPGPPRKIRLESAWDPSTAETSRPPLPDAGAIPVVSSPTSAQDEENATGLSDTVEPNSDLMLPNFESDTEPFLHVIQSVDWDTHDLGPMDEWPVRLQQAFHQTIPDSRAISIYWGPEYRAIYNEAFSRFLGSHHPRLLGEPVLGAWPYLKEHLDHMWNAPAQTGPKTTEGESKVFVEHADGSLEETYLRWSLSPIVENRQCVGMQHSLLEATSMRLWERRMKMLVDLGDALLTARNIQSYWGKIMEQLERWSPTYDVPVAFIYAVDDDDESKSSDALYDCPRTCRLAGSLGVPDNHPIAPPVLELRNTDKGLAPRLREALKKQVSLIIQTKDGTLPEALLDGIKWRGFGDPCQAAVVLPIRPTRDEDIMGLLFLGLNPRRPYDNDYRQFISLLNQKLRSSLAATVLLEEEARRGRNAAAQSAYDKSMLQKKLAWQTEQANQSIQNFQAVAEFIPVGMSFVDNHGNVTFANNAWYRLTGYPMGRIDQGALLECVIPEDKPKILEAYDRLKQVDTVTFEFRIPRDGDHSRNAALSPRSAPVEYDERAGRHILASAKAERDEEGNVLRMLTCLTDVTVQKDTAEEAVRRAQEAENLKRLAEFATVGMYGISLDGRRLLSANDSFWELCGLPKVDPSKMALDPWNSCVVEEDVPILEDCLAELREHGLPQSAEIRLKTTWTTSDATGKPITAARSVMATFMPVKSSDGVLQSFTGCISDVSLHKWQLEREKGRKEEALESKRQQENFIDMTSHEMRNPLSAIIHCTDAIIASLSRVEDLDRETTAFPSLRGPDRDRAPQQHQPLIEAGANAERRDLLRDAIDLAETIETCAQHQKRIVDDILTMSKLDSKLLTVTPCTVNPISIAADALRMFEVEARRVDIALTSMVDPSYTALGYKYLDLDPSRVKQVLINLLTNALKFTKTGNVRNVHICMKASRGPPGRGQTTVDFIPRFRARADEYEQPALRDRSDPVYLLFEVTDTGQGLNEEEKGMLFNKFVQASAKTHVKYGGSGLGLFISRRLTELQNGAIGVSSQPGVGSTFAFYIEAYVPSEEARKEAEVAAAAAKVVQRAQWETAGGRGDAEPARDAKMHRRIHSGSGKIPVDGILIVEDNLINQHIARRGLVARGFAVDVANHGLEALEKLQRSAEATQGGVLGQEAAEETGMAAPPTPTPLGSPTSPAPPINLVLMDMEMPVQDGLTCTRQIRELESKGAVFCASGGRMPVIAVTANARPEQVEEAKLAGCDEVLVKPYKIPELIELMQVVTRRLKGLSPDSLPD